jgi:hypothetical protein
LNTRFGSVLPADVSVKLVVPSNVHVEVAASLIVVLEPISQSPAIVLALVSSSHVDASLYVDVFTNEPFISIVELPKL